MATDLLSNLLSSPSFTLTNSTAGGAVATKLKISKVSIRLSSRLMRHMLEDGSSFVDARVIQPTSVVVEAFCPDLDTVAQVDVLFRDRANLYSLSSKGLVINQLMVEGQSLFQSPEMMSAVPIRIPFKQVLTKDSQAAVFAQPSDSDLVDRGMAVLTSATTTLSNVAASISNFFNG